MKTLYLLRHAKSETSGWGGKDFERPLNDRGLRACAAMAAHLQEKGIRPSVILCSSAVRARQTLEQIAAALGWPDADNRPRLVFRDELYLASENQLLAEVREIDDSNKSTMIVGHNPGIEVLAIGLSGRGNHDAIEALERKYPTAALATLKIASNQWRDFGASASELVAFVKPSMLAAMT